MREIRNTKIIAVDHGYGNIKTANTVTPTGITAYETEPIFTGNILEYNGIYYRIGEGHKEFIPDKAMDEDYYLLTLMAVAQELNVFSIHEADVHLAAGLPLTWIRNQREAFRSYLLQNPEVRFSFNSKNYHIRFVGCSLYPQGYPAVVNHLGDFKGTNLLADIGNGTMNILYINNKKAQESRCWTANLKGGQLNRIYAKEDKVKIKIEIDSGMISPREYAVRTIAKEIVKTGIKEKQIWYNEAAIQTELENEEVGRLVRCWLKNVWPLPQLRSLQSRLSHLR